MNVIPRRTDAEHEAISMAQPITPKSERRWGFHGTLGMSLSNLRGDRCPEARCFYAPGHKGPHAGVRN